jgi:hypothetical protein
MDSYDLILSNYAFSECKKEFQDEYLERVLRPATRGYLTCNYCDPATYSKAEILERLKKIVANVEEVSEEPLTSPNNYIVVWK